ncbi:MAG TPA: VIT domain-containing protein, partial [Nannocystaceae bacterium]|nr:VIT domain-containing protein [Nannocystaceae bacterium]
GASLSFESGQAQVYVAEGLAIVSAAGGRAEVEAGERATVQAGAPTVEPVAFWDDWTGGMGDRAGGGLRAGAGSGALYAVDRAGPAGAPALPLSIQRQTVKVALEDEIAETLVDQRFFNPSSTAVEGWYWFTVPEGAQLTGFTLETEGRLVEGEIVERHEAAAKYEAGIQRAFDPALLEWIDARTVRARIHPVPALGARRILVRYQQLVSEAEGKLRYSYPLGAAEDAPTIEEFALQVDLGELADRYDVSTLAEARIEADGKRITMRRSGYTPRSDFQLELTRKQDTKVEPMRVAVLDPGGDQARFVMARWTPDLALEDVAVPPAEVVVVVDTSAAGDTAEHQTRLAVAEALLRSLSSDDRFVVMAADLDATILHPRDGLAEATPPAIATALEALARHTTGGATDLGAIFESALARVHGLEQPAVVYVGDGLATSGERNSDALAERLRRSMADSRARLFTIGVGRELDEALLDRLARTGGGTSLRVDVPEQAVVRALELSGAIKAPVITDLELDLGEGLDDVFSNATGKLARGRELVVLARTHHEVPDEIVVRGRVAGEAFERTYDPEADDGAVVQAVPKLWAGAYVERLLGDGRGPEAVRGQVLSLGLEYGLMTPYTSYLALDSEQAYAAMGVQRRQRRFAGVRLVADASIVRGQDDTPRGIGVLESIAGGLAAPLGCNASAPSERASDVVASPTPTPEMSGQSRSGPVPGAPATVEPPAPPSDGERTIEAPKTPASPEPVEELAEAAMDGSAAGVPVAASDGRPSGADEAVASESKRSQAARTGIVDDDAKGEDGGETKEASGRPASARVVSTVARGRKAPCSDAAARPLAERRILWVRRLALTTDMSGALAAYEAAAASCELPGWKDQRAILGLLQARADNEHGIALLLAHFADDGDARTWLARAMMRRLVDPALLAAVSTAMFGQAVDWEAIDRKVALATSGADQIDLVRTALARAPGDPAGETRMIELLAKHGRISDAIARARRLREQGLVTSALALALGELLVERGETDEARRVFSELVEFDPASTPSRRMLGDVFLRHGWSDEAYRQYDDLATAAPDDAAIGIRLARAAAGAKRGDEALRLLRKVAAGEGRPGADDPRRHARLHAAALLAAMLAGDAKSEVPAASVARELRRLQLFDAPATWTLLVWDDLAAQLVLARTDDETLDDIVVAGDTGLFAARSAAGALPELVVRQGGTQVARDVAWTRLTIEFDGSEFRVTSDAGTVKPRPIESAANG